MRTLLMTSRKVELGTGNLCFDGMAWNFVSKKIYESWNDFITKNENICFIEFQVFCIFVYFFHYIVFLIFSNFEIITKPRKFT